MITIKYDKRSNIIMAPKAVIIEYCRTGIRNDPPGHVIIALRRNNGTISAALSSGVVITDPSRLPVLQNDGRYNWPDVPDLVSTNVTCANKYNNNVADFELMEFFCRSWGRNNQNRPSGAQFPFNCRGCVDYILRECGLPSPYSK